MVTIGGLVSACGSSGTTIQPPPVTQVGQVVINNGSSPILLEQGLHVTLPVTVRSTTGTVIDYPVVWSSSNTNVATIDVNGRVTAVDTVSNGLAQITATSANSVKSNIVSIVVGQIVKKIDQFNYTPLASNSPGARPDSLRVQVTSVNGGVVPNRKVAFAVTAGGGKVSPDTAVTNNLGVAATQWTFGPTTGLNTVVATVLNSENAPTAYANPSTATFTVRTFDAIIAVAGDNQSGVILSKLPVDPAVRVVDSLGKPRPGIPVKFAVSSGGKITTAVVSTGANGVASPGSWILGDTPGPQILVATTDNATLQLSATGTGTPQYYTSKFITAGQYVSCAINSDDTASCWGEQPKVGDSTNTNRRIPTLTKGGVKFSSLSAGVDFVTSHVCGVGLDKSVYCWGLFSYPDTTTNTTVLSAVSPVRYPTDILFSQASTGQSHNCALSTDQNIYCWGSNNAGQLGDAKTVSRLTPAAVSGGFKFQSVTSGGGHSCGLAVDGAAYCWGTGSSGQLGNGTASSLSSPTAVSGNIVFTQISAGDFFTCGITATGAVYCWGNLQSGAPSLSPKQFTTAPVLTSISAGGAHVCGLTADGSAYCWLDNSAGQLGDSTTTFRANPTAVATTAKYKSIAAGYGHTCAITTTSAVMCWGLNNAGELGDSTLAIGAIRTQPRYIVLGVTPPAAGFLSASKARKK